MKHVFLVNSHTTFLSSLGTKEYLKVKDEDVVLLFARGYTNSIYPHNYIVVDIDDIYLNAEKAFWTFKWKIKKQYVCKVDKIIQEVIRGDFHLYVPNFNNAAVRLFYTSKYCKRISFIQEGAQIHTTAWNGQGTIKSIINIIFYNIIFLKPPRLWLIGCYYKKYYLYKQNKMHTYALDEKIFAGIDAEHHIIKWPIPEVKLQYKQDATYFILDGLVKNLMCEHDVLLRCTERLVEENASSFNYLKFHPNQSKEERTEIISYFEKRGLEYEVMDQSIPFELILVSMHNLKIIGMASSLCFFGRQLGHSVVCHDDWLYEESELFKKHLERTGIQLYKNIYKQKSI